MLRKFIDKRGLTSDDLVALSSTAGADVAANTEAGTITVPAGERWILHSVHVELVQGATQTPWPRLIIDRGADAQIVAAAHAGTAAQAASTTCQHVWAAGSPTIGPTGATTAVIATGTLPTGLVLEAGYRIRFSTVGLGANSNYGAATAHYQKITV